ncbi:MULTISPECIES: cell division protein ZapE [unclassified Pseudomonas]|uniref:cell division protein ZapE n=1 Tax=unclassified Pseudomonas TaxID=196821 RepID=UPI00244BF44E|nr:MULTISPECIES: cell division protein ZapE [unclassified Pseudomonas]MDH0302068.1 cell division protein ZapE [Pseudomonas sp. GD04091]MDH1984097.1 cell division protein ZapE [Pseudomonas sp. GD03689]
MSIWIPAPLRHLGRRRHADAPATSALMEHFQRRAGERGYTVSDGQRRVIEAMAAQLDALATGRAHSLYLHGAVGRGKSWLLDVFFEAVPTPSKRRLHFHDFFARLHQGMHQHRALDDALGTTLDELLGDCRVLCFDEFHVHDIGDAMLLTRLFDALFTRGVLLLLTSNYAPEGLLPNPLYHERFLPVIRLLNSHMQVLELGGDTDGPQVMFGFHDLCEQATAVIDYLVLAERFERWIIDGLDDLAECSLAAQQRFVNLIDVLYDQDRELVLLGRRPLAQSLGGALADLMRTRSRLGQLHQVGPGQPLAEL